MKNLYESILGDIDITLTKSDKNVELVNLNLPEFDDFKRAVNRRGGGAIALYIWKMPNKVLNKVQDIIYKITSKMTWLSPYEQNPTNIIVGCSPNKLYIKLAVDRTIVGIPVLNFNSGYKIQGISTKNFDDCKKLAYRLLLAIADVDNLEELLTAHENGYYNQSKMLEKLLDKPKFFMEGILSDIDDQITNNDETINKFNVFTEIFKPFHVNFNTYYLDQFNREFDWKLIKDDAKGLNFRTKLFETEYNKELKLLEKGKYDKEAKIFKKFKDLLLIIDNLKLPNNVLDRDPKQKPSIYYHTFNELIKKYIKFGSQNNIYVIDYDNNFMKLNITKFVKSIGSWEFLLTVKLNHAK